jgi:lysophospholipase L1-like esterase
MPVAIALITASLLVVALGFVGRGLVQRRQANGAERLAKSLHLNARWWREQGDRPGELLYVAIGDSAAQGVGASRPGRSYVGLVAKHLRDRTGRSVRVLNLSISGARLREAIAKQLPQIAGLEPDLMTVAIGANDIAAFDSARFAKELATIYDALPPGAIVSELPAFYLGDAERNVAIANGIVHDLASRHGFPVAPLHSVTRRQGVVRYALNQVSADFFHPNDRGYRVWASAFLPLVEARFPAR